MPLINAAPVSVRGRFHRSVQLERDWREHNGLLDYLVTPAVRDLTRRIVQELKRPGGTRAWSITGPYGTGKSSFALFLARFLGGEIGEHSDARVLREQLDLDDTLLPVLIGGQRVPLKPALVQALGHTVAGVDSGLAQEAFALSRRSRIEDDAVAGMFERTAAKVVDRGFGGLILVLDEFGKFLEYAASNPDSEDLLVMQALAETAARSPVPLLVATILHTSFAAYLNSKSEVQQAEWQKVQGRFTDVAFQEPSEQVLRLVGEAIETHFAANLSHRYARTIRWIYDHAALAEVRDRLPIGKLLPECLPLDPVTSLLLSPLFRSKLAQNERSLFSFLTSQEPFGLQEFLRRADWSSNPPPLFRLPQLYDYVSSSLGVGAYRGDLARRWVEIDGAIERVGADAPPLVADTIKALGLLWMYGAAVGLRASETMLQLALGAPNQVSEALEYLQKHSIVVHRKFEGAYALWEGSDVDLNERFEAAKTHIGRGSLAMRLRKAVTLQAIVARAHYISRGTLRYFDVDVIDGHEANLENVFFAPLGNSDGRVVYVLAHDASTRNCLMEAALELTNSDALDHRLRIIAFPKPLAGLEDALRAYEAWQWVRSNTPALKGDLVASKELRARLRYAKLRLESIAGNVLGLRGYRFEPRQSDWIQGGRRHAPNDAKRFLRWVSDLCDEGFSRAPEFHNELLNRSSPSTAANSALYKLIRAMVTDTCTERFGISGYPPEVSMYESLVRMGGFHYADETQQRWRIGEPNDNWQPTWGEMEAFLASTHSRRRSVSELFDRLKRPPYGMRQGPMPVLLIAMLLVKRNSVAVYESGLFQPGLTAQLAEQIARNPDTFEVQEFVFDEESRELLASLNDVVQTFDSSASQPDESPLLRIARPLILFAARLPRYAKNTKHLEPPEAAEIREALLRARDPHDLLLNEIPRILGLASRTASARQELAHRLEASLVALQRAYPSLLDSIEEQIKTAFGLPGTTSEEVQAELAQKAIRLKGLAVEPKLMAFISRASHAETNNDWREALGLVVFHSRAPVDWSDADRAAFQTNLQQLASDFRRLEELALEQKRSDASQVLRIGVLGAKYEETRELISLHAADKPHVDRLAKSLQEVLLSHAMVGDLHDERRIKVAALSRLVLQYLEAQER